MSLIEVLVVIAILIAMAAVAVPALQSVFMLEQRRAAQELCVTYERLHTEAVLRNKTFRIAYHLDDNFYEIQSGDAGLLIFSSAEARERYEESSEERLENMTEEELRELKSKEDFKTAEGAYQAKVKLPDHTRFAGVYTPQYETMRRPGDKGDVETEDGGEVQNIVYSYVFANGFTEPTVIQMVSADDAEDGYTIEIEPLSGRVRLHPDLIDYRDSFGFIPEDGPSLPN